MKKFLSKQVIFIKNGEESGIFFKIQVKWRRKRYQKLKLAKKMVSNN